MRSAAPVESKSILMYKPLKSNKPVAMLKIEYKLKQNNGKKNKQKFQTKQVPCDFVRDF